MHASPKNSALRAVAKRHWPIFAVEISLRFVIESGAAFAWQRITIDPMTDPADDDGLYEFAEKSPPKKAVKPLRVVDPAAPGVLPYRAKREDRPKPAEPETIKDVYLPIGLLAGGILVETLSAIIWGHRVAGAFAEMAVDLTIGTGVMLAAMLIAAKLRNIQLGNIGVAAYKLAAISIAPTAVMEFVTPIASVIPFGFIGCWIVEFGLFFALLGALFDLDESDTWFCVWTIFLTRIGVFVLLRAVFGA